MKSGVIALSPRLAEEPAQLALLGAKIRALQTLGILTRLQAAAVVHPDLYSYPLDFFQSAKTELCHQAREALSKLMRLYFAVDKLTVFPRAASDREALAETLSTFALRRRASVLVIGSPGAKTFLSRVLGSVAENAINGAEIPVLVLPHGEIPEPAPERIIVFAVEGKRPPSRRALRHLARAARLTAASVRILHVRPPSSRLSRLSLLLRGLPPETCTELELIKISRFLEDQGVTNYRETVDAKETVAATIDSFAARYRALMVAVQPAERSWIRVPFLGSTAASLLRHCSRPLYVLRPD